MDSALKSKKNIAKNKNESDYNLGKIIKDYRRKKYFTQSGLAEKLNISYQLLQKYEYNKCRPSLETLSKLIYILEIPVDKILPGIRKN